MHVNEAREQAMQANDALVSPASRPATVANGASTAPIDQEPRNSPLQNPPLDGTIPPPSNNGASVATMAAAASTQKRWLTQPKSKVATADLVTALRHEDAWQSLPKETREKLYELLPPPRENEEPHDVDVHPLQTRLKSHIEASIRTWQNGLVDGREVKSWRDEALQAERDRAEGKWDAFKQYQRDADWGPEEESTKDERD